MNTKISRHTIDPLETLSFGSFKILPGREGTSQGCSSSKQAPQPVVTLVHQEGGWEPRGAEARLVWCRLQASEQPPLAPLAPATIPKALFPLDPGSWPPASLATGSPNVFISAPVPGQEVSYSCKIHRRSTGKRRNMTYTLSWAWGPEGTCS